MAHHRILRRRRGVSLVEALVAMAVMAFGMLALVGVQANLRLNSDVAKQRGEATRIATEEIELLRGFQTMAVVNGQSADLAYDGIASRTVGYVDPNGIGNTTFTITRTVIPAAGLPQKTVSVVVSWTDRSDQPQSVSIEAVISGTDPALSGLLAVLPKGSAATQIAGRHPSIPPVALDLGNGKSGFKPFDTGTVVWVFDNLSGAVVGRCTGVSALQADLTSNDLTTCQAIQALLLAGEVDFNFRLYTHDLGNGFVVLKPVYGSTTALQIDASTGRIVSRCTVPAGTDYASLTPPDLTACVAVDPPRAVTPFQLTCLSAPCSPDPATALVATDSEAPQWPTLNLSIVLASTGDTSVDTLQFNQTQAPECVTNAPTNWSQSLSRSERTVRYFCLVYPGSGGWGGRFDLQPQSFADPGSLAWQTAADATGLKVCRYTRASTDYTVNRDHPATYCMQRSGTPTTAIPCIGQRVNGNLVNQNFLVIGGNQSCPVDSAIDPAAGDLVNSNTLPHQP